MPTRMMARKRRACDLAEMFGDWLVQLGPRVKMLRVAVGMTQEELAKVVGVSQASVSRLERGCGRDTPFAVVRAVSVALIQAAGSADVMQLPGVRAAVVMLQDAGSDLRL